MTDYSQKIFDDVKINTDRLKSCKAHRFGSVSMVEHVIGGVRVTCELCRGTIPIGEALAYQDGYIAAGGNGDDVLINTDKGEYVETESN